MVTLPVLYSCLSALLYIVHVKLIFPFLCNLRSVPALSCHPSFSLWLVAMHTHTRYFYIPPFAVLLQWIKSVKWKWGASRFLSLSLSASLSFQTSKRGYASNVFLRSWSAAKSYKWSKERDGGREWAECRGRREGARDKKDGRGEWKMNKGERHSERWGQSMGLIQEHLCFFSYYSLAQHNLSFLLSNYSSALAQDQLIRWHAALMPAAEIGDRGALSSAIENMCS